MVGRARARRRIDRHRTKRVSRERDLGEKGKGRGRKWGTEGGKGWGAKGIPAAAACRSRRVGINQGAGVVMDGRVWPLVAGAGAQTSTRAWALSRTLGRTRAGGAQAQSCL